ncbi:hypothetical protein LPJ73_005980 [Coemansia sp. RSA 2703]|nr:hypothetical protein LPJ73_005980 [Coemansia sp. RSA 2703]KAJ2376754.1 hypothetical protein IW150_001790 [Coemansia sp. RSA 2607]KAJ2390889.1 hypothetical protein GGI05_003096 [Coemansia sp. RSA 2603]
MRAFTAKVAVCWVLATTAAISLAQENGNSRAEFKRVAEAQVAETIGSQDIFSTPTPTVVPARHPRQLLQSIIDALNPNKDGRADGDSSDAGNTDNTDNTETASDNNNNNSQTSDSTPSSSSRSSRPSNTNSQQTSDTSNDNQDTETSDTPSSRTSRSSTQRTSSTEDNGDESSTNSSTKTSSSKTSSTKSSPTTTSKSTTMVVVTVTRPGSTITTVAPPPPTIDQANGDKADVGTSENLTTIIAAPTATAVALMLFAVLFYLHRRRKNRIRYSDDDAFSKGGAGKATKPYVPPNNPEGLFAPRDHGNDGYIKEEAGNLGDYYPPHVPNDNTLLLPPQQQPPQFGQPAAGSQFHPMDTRHQPSQPHRQPTQLPYQPPHRQQPRPPQFHNQAPPPSQFVNGNTVNNGYWN